MNAGIDDLVKVDNVIEQLFSKCGIETYPYGPVRFRKLDTKNELQMNCILHGCILYS